MDKNGIERSLAHILNAAEHHSDYPEEDDIIACYQCVCGIEILKIFSVVGPAQCGERPQCGGEPCIQSVGILPHRLAALGANCGAFLCNDHLAAVVAVECGYLMTPPYLTGDAPVTDIFKPVEIGLFKAFGNELGLAVLYSVNSGLCKRLHLYEPLCRYLRLNGGSAAVAGSDIMAVILNFNEETALVQIFNYLLSCLVSVHSCVCGIIIGYLCIIGHNVDDGEIMTLTHLKVVGVVGGSYLNNASSEVCFNIFIGNNGNFSADKGKNEHFANDVLVALIVGVYRNGCIAQKCFGTGGSKLNIAAAVLEGISQVPEMTCLILIVYLGIGKGGLAVRTPVDDPLTSVDKTLFVVFYENLLDCLGTALVHCEALS